MLVIVILSEIVKPKEYFMTLKYASKFQLPIQHGQLHEANQEMQWDK